MSAAGDVELLKRGRIDVRLPKRQTYSMSQYKCNIYAYMSELRYSYINTECFALMLSVNGKSVRDNDVVSLDFFQCATKFLMNSLPIHVVR